MKLYQIQFCEGKTKVKAKGFDGSETMKTKWKETVLSRKALRMKENKKEP